MAGSARQLLNSSNEGRRLGSQSLSQGASGPKLAYDPPEAENLI